MTKLIDADDIATAKELGRMAAIINLRVKRKAAAGVAHFGYIVNNPYCHKDRAKRDAWQIEHDNVTNNSDDFLEEIVNG